MQIKTIVYVSVRDIFRIAELKTPDLKSRRLCREIVQFFMKQFDSGNFKYFLLEHQILQSELARGKYDAELSPETVSYMISCLKFANLADNVLLDTWVYDENGKI